MKLQYDVLVPPARWVFRSSIVVAFVTVAILWSVMLPSGIQPRTCPAPIARDTVMGSFAAVIAVTAALMSVAARRVRRIPTELLNVPHPDFWLQPHRVAHARRRIEDDLWWLGTWTMVLLAWLAFATWHSHGRHTNGPGEEWQALAAMSVVLAVGTIVRRGFYGRRRRAVAKGRAGA